MEKKASAIVFSLLVASCASETPLRVEENSAFSQNGKTQTEASFLTEVLKNESLPFTFILIRDDNGDLTITDENENVVAKCARSGIIEYNSSKPQKIVRGSALEELISNVSASDFKNKEGLKLNFSEPGLFSNSYNLTIARLPVKPGGFTYYSYKEGEGVIRKPGR